MAKTRTAWIVTALAVGAVLGATLAPVYDPPRELLAPCLLVCGHEGLADFLVNIVLYLPVGVGFALLGMRVRSAVLLAFALSATIETLQAILPGRDSSAGDVVSNTLGAWTGFLLTTRAHWWLSPSRATAGRLALGWSTFVVATIAVTGFLMQPSFPAGDWYGQWTPRFGHLHSYEGRLAAVTVDGLAVPSRRHPQPDSLRALLIGGARLEVVGIAGPPPDDLAPIFAIADRRQRTMIMLGADETDLYFSYRMRAHGLRMDAPDIRLRERLIDLAPGDSMTLTTWRRPDGICLAVNREETCELGFQAGRGWALFYWLMDSPEWVITGLDVFWMALLFFPFGLWVSRSRSWALAMGTALAGLVFLPGVVGLQPSGFVEFIGLAAGFEVGLLIRRAARTRLTT